ncbi:HAD family hydrolase [Haloimpatiens lingqiaonensis]|uniref:HAD family hydrolase n=1 Tax=Haloimpatiens lingqiaonensis TaxID=1380675 RepID=UPI0010FCF85A|nr:HAD family phosphatase [Haloimpatiens lingqiaonensis]
MIRNIVFDIGNVLLKFDPKAYLTKKFNDEEKVEKILELVFRSDEWLMLDRGTITETEAIKILSERHAFYSESIKDAFNGWYDLLTPMEDTIEILKQLKEKGINNYYLSNFHHLAFEYVTEKNEFFKLFQGGIVSYKEKLLKPEKEIYMRLLEEYNLKTEETIFIDDTLDNIQGAASVGIHTIHFKNSQDLIAKLNELV